MQLNRATLVLTLLLLASSLWAQTGRSSVTGIVTDSSGAVVPGVTVRATNAETAVFAEAVTNTVGNYNIAALPPGQYTFTWTGSGFKQVSQPEVRLSAGQVARIDVTLEVGQVLEQVTITTEAPMLETETSNNAEGVQSRVFSDLPLSFGGGRNMAEFANKLVPGVVGSAWNMKIQGTPAGSAGIVIDGMTNLAGFLPGDFGEASISPEAIQELTVQTGNVTPEYGRQAGGSLSFSLKSGTNDWHGSAFYYLRNEILNANDWNNNLMLASDPNFARPETRNFKRPKDRRKDWGGSIGGPVRIPGLYDGRNRTFFYATYERFKNYQTGPTNLERHTPLPQMFNGDLSRLLTGRQVGTDVLGRAVSEGQIFDPATLRQVNGQFVADPFQGNIIPSSRISRTARGFAPIFADHYSPVGNSITNNLYGTRYYNQTVEQVTAKVDHAFSTAHKVSGYYYQHGFPRHFQDAGGLWSLKDPDYGGPLAKAMEQERRGYTWNVAHDWILSPSMLNHASFGLNVNKNFYGSRQAGKGYAQQWGVTGVGNGLPEERWTAPEFNLGASPVVTFESWGKRDYRDFDYKGFIGSNVLSWQRGAHSIKFGGEWNRLTGEDFRWDSSGGIFNFTSVTTGIPGQPYTAQTGNSFASFLLGEVASASTGPPFNTASRRDYAALFVQDTWKASSRLTLNFGLRWSGNSPIYERNDYIATFNPALPDPNAGGRLGAVEYMGSGPGRSGRRSPASGQWRDLGPSFGLAYRLKQNFVWRLGYGITYTPETIGWQMTPNGFVGGFARNNSVDADTRGLYRPVFNLDAGYPGVETPGTLDPSWAQRRGATLISSDYTKAGYIQHFNAGFQFETLRNTLFEVDWRASKGTRLHSGGNVRPNQIRAEELSRGAVLGQIVDTPQKAAAAGVPYPYPGFSGTAAHALMPFPQLTTRGLTAWGDTVGFTTYHAGNLIVTRRMTHGVYAYAAYTFSKNLGNVNDVVGTGNSTGLQDSYNQRLAKTILPDDRTHRLKATAMWDLPVGKGRALLGDTHPVLNAALGGWTLSALINYSSGAPLTAPNSRRTPVGWNGGTVLADFTPGTSDKIVSIFNPERFDPWTRNSPGNRLFNPAIFSDAPPQWIGTSPPRFATIRTPWNFSEDISILKRFAVTEKMRLQFRLELLNAFNRHYFAGPETNMNLAYFGSVWRASGNRTGQAGLRLEW